MYDLSQLWQIHISEVFIVSKLLYGLIIAVLNKAECYRIDGSQARFLRQILTIIVSYYRIIARFPMLRGGFIW